MTRALMIDNYDSFTFNIVQYLQMLKVEVRVVRNDEMTAEEALRAAGDFIVLSPGPSAPEHAGICLELIAVAYRAKKPLLGVCLGHQAIGQAFGGKVVRANIPVHGKTAQIKHNGKGIFQGVPSPFKAIRYHSLVIEASSCPAELEITAKNDEGLIMAVQHKQAKIMGVQFHPESVLSEYGLRILENFVVQSLI